MTTSIRNIIFLPGWSFNASALSIMEEHLRGYHFYYRHLPQNNDPETCRAIMDFLEYAA
jgi:hypothetical protein